MQIHLDQTNPTPLYEQIAGQIRELILSGHLPAGTALPSIRQLAGELLTSVITTKRAYQELEAAGLIFTRPGVGSIVADLTAEHRNALRLREVKAQLTAVVGGALRLGVRRADLQELFQQVIRESEADDRG